MKEKKILFCDEGRVTGVGGGGRCWLYAYVGGQTKKRVLRQIRKKQHARCERAEHTKLRTVPTHKRADV
jgi:hypothetical protein